MGKSIDWVRKDPSGRLLFRRRYPDEVRPYLAKPGQRELKIPLGAKSIMTKEAFQKWEEATRTFDRNVTQARAAKLRHEKEIAGRRDNLSPELVKRLAEIFLQEWHVSDEAALMKRGDEFASLTREAWQWHRDDFQEWRATGDIEEMESQWGKFADQLVLSQGLLVDPEDDEGRKRLVWALNDVALAYAPDAKARTLGKLVPIPPKPERLKIARGGARTVSALCDAYKAAKWDGWGLSSRKAIAPVLRVLEETIGDREVTSIDRAAAREVFDLVKALPVNLGKRKDLAGLTVPEGVAKAQKLGLPSINPNTVNRAYMVQISAVFNWAVTEDWALKNPFSSLTMADPVEDKDRRDPFTADQLQKLFSMPPWSEREPDEADKPSQFWAPLIALYSGMRLGEIAGLRIMDIEKLEGIWAFRVRPYEGRTLKNKESRRNVPIHSALLAMGLMSFAHYRRSKDKPDALLFPDAEKSERGQWGVNISKNFSRHLVRLKIVGTKLGMHSFRHNFEDRLKASGLHGQAVGQALGGRKVSGSEGNYGGEWPIGLLRDALEKADYPGLDLSHLRKSDAEV